MFKIFQPTWHAHAIYDLTPEVLREHGIKAVLTDLDKKFYVNMVLKLF